MKKIIVPLMFLWSVQLMQATQFTLSNQTSSAVEITIYLSPSGKEEKKEKSPRSKIFRIKSRSTKKIRLDGTLLSRDIVTLRAQPYRETTQQEKQRSSGRVADILYEGEPYIYSNPITNLGLASRVEIIYKQGCDKRILDVTVEKGIIRRSSAARPDVYSSDRYSLPVTENRAQHRTLSRPLSVDAHRDESFQQVPLPETRPRAQAISVSGKDPACSWRPAQPSEEK